MRIETCYFCSSPCYPGHGTTFVRNDSKVRLPLPRFPASPLTSFLLCTACRLHLPASSRPPRPPRRRLTPRPPPQQVFKFCRAKCHRAFQKKRNPRKVKWTKASRKAAGKDLKVDATFEFEKRRNRPVRYDRDLMAATITTMKRVKEIQAARETRFHEQRTRGARTSERAKQKAEIAAHVDLVRPASARVRAAERNAQEKARLTVAAGGGMAEEAR